jgi:hypothetical protein
MDPKITAALIAAGGLIVGALLGGLWLDRRAHRQDLETQYQHDQRRELKKLIGRYHGGLLEYATSWNYRVLNFFQNIHKPWMVRGAVYRDQPHYYFHSSVYRFLTVLSLAQQFESEQIYIDARYVDQNELEFVKFAKAFHWVMSDVALFKGLTYDQDRGEDHFTSDRLRSICDAFRELSRGGRDSESGGGGTSIPTFREFEAGVLQSAGPELQDAFEFFDGLSPDEPRYRWDRLMCLYLLTTALVTTHGYGWQKWRGQTLEHALRHIRNPEVIAAFIEWPPRHGLERQGCLVAVWELAAAAGHAPPPPPTRRILATAAIGSRQISLVRGG